jgi:hypothetical protein
LNPIVTITPLLASPGSYRLAICAENREAFASVVMELRRQWERVEISELSQLPLSGWWHGSGRVRNKVIAPSVRVRGEVAVGGLTQTTRGALGVADHMNRPGSATSTVPKATGAV